MEAYKNLAGQIGFRPKENTSDIFIKKYAGGYSIEIDFERQSINYGDKITVENNTTQNFSQSENGVVLECINRLLEKGYKPENIVLEKTWASGHGTSGRLDICVTRDDGSEYLLIECKTFGKEFKKALTRTKKDGGQLFTYFKFSNKADIIMLYASGLRDNEIVYCNEIIKIEEEYRTGDVKDFYEKWNKLTKDNGVFDAWVNPYQFVSKALTPKHLKPIAQEDSGFIFNRFLEILRNNVVSDKPNAFNKIFTLFLCKVYDEKTTAENEELKFQWLEGKDDDVSFQLRLTDLYKNGMLEFLEKEVTDFSHSEFNTKYKHLDESDKKHLLEDIVKLRLEKNNEFAIKEVFDHQSFLENAKVVKQVVELLQNYRLRYNKRQQYLSDFFELLLTTGLKQEAGQFFTPVPIAQFIIKSLPIDQLTEEKLQRGKRDDLLPYIIDYAAGSGHFLTESMHEIQKILDHKDASGFIADTAKKIKSWQEDHFDWATQYIYGIEKDYRLVKVGKVGCYLHGDGLANVILSDGLANFKNTPQYKGLLKVADKDFPKENKQFDVLLSNPPYSVPAFKQNARDHYTEEDFELYNALTDQSGQIEVLFVERAKQLLKDGGIAGIILPDSILDNDSEINTRARKIILNYFEIVGITELGTNAFMATNIKTKVLFLRRRSNYNSIHLKTSVNNFFTTLQDVTLFGIENAVSKYVNFVWKSISFEDYVSMLKKAPDDALMNHEIFIDYSKKLNYKNSEDKYSKIIAIEKEKLFYFLLTFQQKIVMIKTGEKQKEKQFLGYEFKNRRNQEGIHPIEGNSIEKCTKLFDPDTFHNPQKASTYIYNAFLGNFMDIDKGLNKNIEYINLIDLIDFQTINFNLKIQKTQKISINYEKIWQTNNLQYLSKIASVRKGKAITKAKTIPGDVPVIAGGQSPAYYHNESNRNGNIITISASGAYAGFINYFERPIFASDCNTITSKHEDVLPTKLIYYLLKSLQPQFYQLQRGQAQPHVYRNDIEKVKVPILSRDNAKKILHEIELLEDKAKTIIINNLEEQKEAIIKKYLP